VLTRFLPVTIKRSNFYSLLFLAYIALAFIRAISPDQIINSIASTAIGLYAFSTVRIDRKLQTLILVFTFSLLFSFLVSSMLNIRLDRIIQNLMFILSSSGIALLLTTGLVALWAVSIAFWGLASYFVILMLLSTDPMLALFSSQNSISWMILAAAISYYLVSNRLNKKLNLKPAFVTLIISIWGVGRSGILVGFVLLFGLFFLKSESKVIRTMLITFVILFIFFMAIPLYGSTEQIASFYGFFNDSFFKNAILNYGKTFDSTYTERGDIYLNYFQNLDLFKFFFGVNPKTEDWPDGEFLAYNYHNSFITLHSQTGLFGLIIILLLIISFFTFLKRDKIYSLLIVAFSLRWSTDSYLFFEFFDFVPLFFIFMLFKTFEKALSRPRKKTNHDAAKAGVGRGQTLEASP